jgi:hypothetical protein
MLALHRVMDARGDPSVGNMLAVLRCGMGQPMYRTDKWQSHFGVPLPASTQWKLIAAAAPTPENRPWVASPRAGAGNLLLGRADLVSA